MAQDIARARRTEIDALNGYVVRRGAALGVSTPANELLAGMVRLLEESVAGRNAD
jgi:2-dehydropantoate 2-reductase